MCCSLNKQYRFGFLSETVCLATFVDVYETVRVGTGLGDVGATRLGEALGANTALTALNLQGHGLGWTFIYYSSIYESILPAHATPKPQHDYWS